MTLIPTYKKTCFVQNTYCTSFDAWVFLTLQQIVLSFHFLSMIARKALLVCDPRILIFPLYSL